MTCALIVVAVLNSRPAWMCLNDDALPIFLQWVM